MKVHFGVSDIFNEIKRPVVTVGTFDGVHLGHQKIIKRIRKIAKEIKGESVLLTFDPHPRSVIFNDQNIKLINTLKEKIELLDLQNLDHLIIYPFTTEFSMLNAKDYVSELLINQLNTHTLVIGYDHHFGNDRKGNINLLRNLQSEFQYNLEEIEAQEIDEIKISSTKLRNAIDTGNVQLFKQYSANYFQLNGKVIKGDGIGKKLGFPTANIEILENEKILPSNGVYAVICRVHDEKLNGIMNIGKRPTIKEQSKISIEVHIFNWSKNIYGQSLKVFIIEKIRNEMKFSSTVDLKTQISKDCFKSEKILNETL